MTRFYFAVFLASGIANFLIAIHITRVLAGAGVRVGFYEMRWQLHKHLGTYRKITVEKAGRVGLPFYGYWGSLGLMLLFGALAFASLAQ